MEVAIKKRGKHKGALFFRNIPDDVKNMFKGTCGRRGESMQQVITRLMRIYINEPEILLKKK